MKLPRLLVSTLSLVLCAALTGCVNQKVSKATRASIKTASIVTPAKGAEPQVYADATGQVAASTGIAFGVVGALIGSGIAAANASAGVERWESVTARKQDFVLARVREEVTKEFGRAAGIKFGGTTAPDAKLVFDFIGYGVEHEGDQRFSACIVLSGTIQRGSGKTVWTGLTDGQSKIQRTLEEFQKDPRSYEKALAEAAFAAARTFVSFY